MAEALLHIDCLSDYLNREIRSHLAQAVSAQTPLLCKFHLGLSGSLFVTSHSEVVPYLVIGVA